MIKEGRIWKMIFESRCQRGRGISYIRVGFMWSYGIMSFAELCACIGSSIRRMLSPNRQAR